MKQPHQPSSAPSSQTRNAQRLDAFWRKALAAAPAPPTDATRLAAARTAIFAAAQQHSSAASEHRSFNLWHALTAWWSTSAQGFAPPRWATGLASITLASLVLVLWYERMPEPAWDVDSARVTPAAAHVPAPISIAPIAEPAPDAAMAAPPAARAAERPRAVAKKAPEARLQASPNASMAEAAPANKAIAPERYQPQPATPMPAPFEDAARWHNVSPSSVTLYGAADVAISSEMVQNHALQAQLQASDGIAWRANAQSLFAPLDAAQTKALLVLLQPLAQQATTTAATQPKPLALQQRGSLQLLLKQSGQVRMIAYIDSSPNYQIDWLNTGNKWLASTLMDEAAYNRITETITQPKTPIQKTTAPKQ